MPTARKLPSGSWRCLAYSHSVSLYNDDGSPKLDSNGKPKKKRIYESFTSDDSTRAGKNEAEQAAAEFLLNKSSAASSRYENLTLREAIDKYIESLDALRSPTTVQVYRTIQENGFQDIMDIPLKKLTQQKLQVAVNNEAKRPAKRYKNSDKTISPKTLSNEYGLLTAVINAYYPKLKLDISLSKSDTPIKELIPPDQIYQAVKGTEIELPVLLAMWLSFSMSEIRGLTKSKSILNGNYLAIQEVVVNVDRKPKRKGQAKQDTRKRILKIPPYIKSLIDKTDPEIDEIVTLSGHAIYCRFVRLLKKNGLPAMTFHDLRHVNASVMALLRIPDKYAMERGGWKTDKVMKKIYTHTFSEVREAFDATIDNYFENIIQSSEEALITVEQKRPRDFLISAGGVEESISIGDSLEISYLTPSGPLEKYDGIFTFADPSYLYIDNIKYRINTIRSYKIIPFRA